MADIATHVRIFEATPSDDFVEKRIATVNDLAGRLVKPNAYDSLLGVANDLALASADGGTMPERLAVPVEGAIRDQSPSFVREGQALQMLVCSLLAIDQYLSAVKPSVKVVSVGDVLAVGVWSALEFQPARSEPKLETLRQEVVGRARAVCLQTASKARERVPIPEVKMEKPAEDLSDLSAKVKSAMGGPVEALENNAAIDREELDLLWWALSGQTDLLKGAFSAVKAAAAAVASGLKAAQLLRRLPADAHRNLVLRNVREDRRLSLADCRSLGYSEATSRIHDRHRRRAASPRIPQRSPASFRVAQAVARRSGRRRSLVGHCRATSTRRDLWPLHHDLSASKPSLLRGGPNLARYRGAARRLRPHPQPPYPNGGLEDLPLCGQPGFTADADR